MSGIAGYFHLKSGIKTGSTNLTDMLQTMSVEGSCDIRFVFEAPDIAIGGMVSNSIEDVACWADGETVTAFQGRITNLDELAKKLTIPLKDKVRSEAHLVTRLYRKIGKNTASVLKGRFCFALWDKRKRRLFLATDRYGYGFMYYYQAYQQ